MSNPRKKVEEEGVDFGAESSEESSVGVESKVDEEESQDDSPLPSTPSMKYPSPLMSDDDGSEGAEESEGSERVEEDVPKQKIPSDSEEEALGRGGPKFFKDGEHRKPKPDVMDYDYEPPEFTQPSAADEEQMQVLDQADEVDREEDDPVPRQQIHAALGLGGPSTSEGTQEEQSRAMLVQQQNLQRFKNRMAASGGSYQGISAEDLAKAGSSSQSPSDEEDDGKDGKTGKSKKQKKKGSHRGPMYLRKRDPKDDRDPPAGGSGASSFGGGAGSSSSGHHGGGGYSGGSGTSGATSSASYHGVTACKNTVGSALLTPENSEAESPKSKVSDSKERPSYPVSLDSLDPCHILGERKAFVLPQHAIEFARDHENFIKDQIEEVKRDKIKFNVKKRMDKSDSLYWDMCSSALVGVLAYGALYIGAKIVNRCI